MMPRNGKGLALMFALVTLLLTLAKSYNRQSRRMQKEELRILMNIIERNTGTQLSKALFWNGEFLASLFEINRLIHNRVKESQSIVASQVRKLWLFSFIS